MANQKSSLIDWKVESQRFDAVATQYEQYRPSYPAQLIDDVVTLSGLQPDAHVLEIGSGTGKATRLFAQRGYAVLCLEPGQNLVDVARESLQAFPQLRFHKSRFEEWDAGRKRFDLIFSAQAFHWVPQEIRFVKTAALLKPKGHLAIFWNMYPDIGGAIRRGLDEAYRRYAPELVREETPLDALIQQRAASLAAEPQFENVIVRTYPWAARYKTEAYLGLLNTYSDHLRLPEPKRQRLFAAIAALIEKNGGEIERPYLAVLYLARRK